MKHFSEKRSERDAVPHRVTCAKCRKRSQTWLGADDMETIGWRKVGGRYWCPFCTGILGPLKRIFKQSR